jgi:hypothetical protein
MCFTRITLLPPDLEKDLERRRRMESFALKRCRRITEAGGPLSPTFAHRLMYWKSIYERVRVDCWALPV